MVIAEISLTTVRNYWWSPERLPLVDVLLTRPHDQGWPPGRITIRFPPIPHHFKGSAGQIGQGQTPWIYGPQRP